MNKLIAYQNLLNIGTPIILIFYMFIQKKLTISKIKYLSVLFSRNVLLIILKENVLKIIIRKQV